MPKMASLQFVFITMCWMGICLSIYINFIGEVMADA